MCFLSVLIVTVVKRVRVRENAGSGRDGGWGERMSACETKRGAEREGGGERGACARARARACVCVCVCVFSIVIILIT